MHGKDVAKSKACDTRRFRQDRYHGEEECSRPDRIVVLGQCANDKKHGKGSVQRQLECVLRRLENDKMDGKGITRCFSSTTFKMFHTKLPTPFLYLIYEGEHRDNKATGKGVLALHTGERIAGQFNDILAYGRCEATLPDGTRYTGDFVKGVRHGRGGTVSPRGATYEGEWRNNLPHGRGVMKFPDGGKYDGEYRGFPNGTGTLYYPDGEKYAGQFINGQRYGNGTLYSKTGAIEKKGVWMHDKFMGE